jgi:hypothetical protein
LLQSSGYNVWPGLALFSGVAVAYALGCFSTSYYYVRGFKPFGPVVGIKPAQFQPMFLTTDAFAGFIAATELTT